MGFDAIADALKAIKAGQMIGTIAQQPKLMGQLAVDDLTERFSEEELLYVFRDWS